MDWPYNVLYLAALYSYIVGGVVTFFVLMEKAKVKEEHYGAALFLWVILGMLWGIVVPAIYIASYLCKNKGGSK